jgi:uncharacterized protein
MIVGTLRARLLIREARTLKDKRQVVKSIKDKLSNSFNVSVAEVDALENPRVAVLGFAMICNESHPIKIALGRIVDALRVHPVAELLDHEIDV